MNQVFRYKAQDNNGDQRFINILISVVRENLKQGNFIAFNSDDDRFTSPLDSAQFERVLTGGSGCDTQAVYNLQDPTKIDKYVVNCNGLAPDDIMKFRIKEDWVLTGSQVECFAELLGLPL